MKSAPAAIASSDARRTLSYVPSSPVSRITFRCASPHGLLDLHDLVVDLRVAAREERAAVDHHVDLVGAQLDRAPRPRASLSVERRLPGRERRSRRHATLTPVPREPLDARRDEVRVDADRGDRRDRRVARDRGASPSSRARRPCPACRRPRASSGPCSGSRGERPELRLLLDRALREPAARSSTATSSIEPMRGSRGSSGSSKPRGSAGACAMR